MSSDDPKRPPLRSSKGLGQAIGGVLAGFDYQVFRASKPPAEMVEAARPVRGLAGEGGDLVNVDFPADPSPPDGDDAPQGRAARRKPPSV